PLKKGKPIFSTAAYKKKQQENKNDGLVSKQRWASLHAEYLEMSCSGKTIHVPTLAAKYGFAEQTVRNKMSREHWHDDILKIAKEREKAMTVKLSERSFQAIE